jgi:gliding motility-associated-like protein
LDYQLYFQYQKRILDVVCNDQNGPSNDGTATITTTNGVGPFSYTLNGVTNGTGVFTGLAQGNYTANVTDSKGCSASVSVNIGLPALFSVSESHTNVVCNDQNGPSNNGTATITTTNGVGPFSYTLNGVTNGTGVFTGLAQGNYTANVTDSKGCSASVSVNIGLPALFSVSETHTNVVCNDQNGPSNNGTATITTTNGVGPFSYTLNGVTNGTGVFTGLAQGNYTANVTDSKGCSASVSVNIGLPALFSVSETHTNVVCNDQNGPSNNGTATITTTNGVGPFSYTLNGVTNGTGVFTGLAQGNYTANVTDSKGCSASVSVNIGLPALFSVSETHTDVVCNDDNGSSNDGTATLTITNGVAPFSYSLNGVTNGTGVFNGLAQGQYTGVVTDDNGCTASVSVTIGIAQPFTAQETHTDVVCNDDNGSSNDGTATLTTTNGVAPFSYSLNGVTNGTGVFNGLVQGQYTGVVTDDNGCTASVSVTIGIAQPFTAQETHTDVVCNDGSGTSDDGTATLTTANGVGPFSYTLSGVTNGTGIFTNLASGLYVGVITDNNGCTASVNVNINQASELSLTETHTDVVCNDDNGSSNDGTATLTTTNGVAPFSYTLNGVTNGTGVFNGLAQGQYTGVVTDDNGCTASVSVTIGIAQPFTAQETHTDVVCNDGSGTSDDGTATLTATNGEGTFSYTLNGVTNGTGIFTNLASGLYVGVITDNNGCTASVNVNINQASELSLTETHTDVVCNDDNGSSNDGTATLTTTNGVAPFSYTLNGVTNGTGIFTGLSEGQYTGVVTDDNGCSASVSVTIGIAQPFTAQETHTDVVCNDGSGTSDDGTATLTATNGEGPFSYTLNGVTNNTGIFTNLASGLYVGVITDDNGCKASVNVNINQASELSLTETHTDVVCNDDNGSSNDGTATLTTTNGVAPFSYTLNGVTNGTGVYNGLAQGQYTGVVTDDNGCTASVSVTIGIAQPFTAQETHTDVVCNDDNGSSNNGTATITLTNGIAPFSYTLNGVTNGTGIFTGLSEGQYTGVVTDDNGCTASVSVTIGIAQPFTAQETHTDVVCNDGSGTSDDGTTTLTATNGVGPFSYTLNGVTNNTGIFTNLASGLYVGVITDDNGCKASVNVNINQASELSLTETHTDVVCNDDNGSSNDGTATLTTTNGVAPFSYTLNGVTNGTGVYNGLAQGQYTGVVTDDNGCTASVSVTIGIAQPFTAQETHTDVVCNDDNGSSNNGTATITLTNGIAPFSYTLNGVTNGTGIFTGLSEGQYTGVVTDDNGCTASVSVTIGIAQPFTAQETHTDVVCNDGSGTSDDGTTTLTATNGVGPFSYTLNGVTNNTGIFTNLASGLYVGVITDDNGCKASVNVNINQASELSLTETHTDVVCNDDDGSSNDGTATLTTTNGVAPFSYTLNGVTNGTGVFTSLAQGQYTGIVTDDNGCTASVSVTIGIAQPFTAQETHTDVVCNDGSGTSDDGTATLTATNGEGTFSYTLNGVTNGTGIFTNLASGLYVGVITDNNGCTASVNVNINQASELSLTETHTDVVCNDDNGSSNDGTATLTTTNGVAPFSYTLNGVTNGTGIFTGLSEGQYTGVVTDDNGCSASVSVTIGIAQPFTAQETHTDVVCNDGSGTSDDGTATLTATNGEGPFSYTLNGVTNNTGIFTNLASGLYVGVITDDNGCKASVNVNINQASELSLAETHTDVVCNDDNGSSNDGTATLTTTNGVAPFSYTLNGVTNGTGVFNGLAQGQYTGVVTDDNGCTASVSVTIGIAQPFTAQETHTDVVCNDGSGTSDDGTATLTATNGEGPFSYTLNGVTNNTGIFTNLASGLYVGVITDDNGCKASVNVNINQASELSLAETHTDVVCNDDNGSSNDGTATLTTTNGVAPFSYTLNGVTNGTGVFNGLAQGQYTGVVTDDNGCTASVSVTIGIAQPFTAQETHTDVVCNDDNGSSNNGTATITVTNGIAPFSYTLNGITNGTGIFTGLSDGQYTGVVTDDNGCTASVTVTIGIAQPFTAQETHTDVVCNDDNGFSNDGTATITVTNGIAPFSYTLNGVTNGTGIFTGLSEGQYTGVVTDDNGCTASVSVTIGIAQPFTAQETHTDVVCNDDNGSSNNGTATITVTNGIAPFSYTLNGITNGTGIFTGLSEGQYTGVVTDDNGCTASVSVTIGIAQPFTAQETHTDVVCNDDNGSSNDGTATLTTTNGIAPFSYTLNGITNGTGIFTGLSEGQYTGVVTDDNGCTASVSVTIGIAQPFTAQETHTDVICNDDNGSSNDGTATIIVTNGVAPFSYTLNGESNGTGIFTGLSEGQYTGVVTDDNGCTASVSVTIGIAQPFTAQETHTDVVCNDDNGSSNDGTATITVTNGIAPFSYTLNGITNGTGIFTGLSEGQYTGVVTDNNGCTASVSVTIGIAQPFTAQETHTDVVCNDDNGSSNDGTATITVTNGIAPFSYTLNGITNGTGIFTGLSEGDYTAIITDGNRCQASVSVTIGIAQPFTAQETHTDVVCNDDNGSSNDGTATITVTNGIAPFTYTLNGESNGTGIFTGLSEGQYTGIVIDDNGCTASVSVTIGIAEPFTAQETHTDVVCNDDNGSSNDGTATITVTNGVAPFTYTLNGESNGTGIFTGLSEGNYTAIVTDGSRCQASVSVTIGIAQPFTAQETHTDVVCNDDNGSSNDGTATITVTNGIAPFSYTLNGVTNGTGVFTGLSEGQYTGVVTDDNGCSASVSVTIGIAQPFTAQETHTDVVCNDDNGSSNNGTATITVTNGIAPFSYTLNGVTNGTGVFTGLSEGQYIGIVTDDNGCAASVSITIGIAQPFTAQETHTDVVCNDDNGSSNDGTATIIVTNGVAPFSYTLNGVTNGTGIFTGLSEGQYTGVVTDDNGCTASVSVTIGIAQPFTAQETHTDVICNDDNGSSNDGAATITVTNGVAPFTYTLNGESNGTGIFTGLSEGNYTAIVTDGNRCQASVSVTIGIAQPFTAQETHTDVVCNDDNGSSNDGTATLTTTNGIAPFSYTLNGVTNGTGIFTGLSEGQYTGVVTDDNGCTTSVSVTIGIAQPFTAQETHTDVVCNDDNDSSNDGTATLTTTNGIAPFSYTLNGITNGTGIFTGLSEGQYTGVVTDDNGCTASVSVTIGIAQPFTAQETHTDIVCNDDNGSSNDGTATLTVTNGVAPFTYTIDGMSNNTGVFNGLSAGTFIGTVEDANGCTASVSVTIGIAEPFTAQETHTNVVCNDKNGSSNDGTATITVSNGNAPFSYSLNGVTNGTGVFTDLPAGNFTAIVTDASGCVASVEFNIEQPRLLEVTQSNIPVTCLELGSIDITVTGGTPPYQYLWNTGVMTEDISGLNVGIYGVSVMDKNGCHTSLTINLGGNEFDSIVPTTEIVTAIITGEDPISVCLEQELELDGPIENVFVCQEPTRILYEFVFDDNSVCFDIERIDDEQTTDTICVVTCDASVCAPCDTTYIIVVVLPIGNGGPVVPDSCIEVKATESIIIDALANVTDPDNDNLSITEITDGPEYGNATISSDGQSINYTPRFGYCGGDTIYFEVCDARGLCSNAFICITIECECFVPNVITPNNDGLNDFFEVPCLEEIDNGFLRVYNRWGNEVYRNENYKNEWNGFYKGNPLPDGTYYYVLEFTDQQGQFRNLAGDLTILQ